MTQISLFKILKIPHWCHTITVTDSLVAKLDTHAIFWNVTARVCLSIKNNNRIESVLRKIGHETYTECINNPYNRNPTYNLSKVIVAELDLRDNQFWLRKTSRTWPNKIRRRLHPNTSTEGGRLWYDVIAKPQHTTREAAPIFTNELKPPSCLRQMPKPPKQSGPRIRGSRQLSSLPNHISCCSSFDFMCYY